MAAYVIYQGEVTDAARYDVYKSRAAASIEHAGGRYVARAGDVAAREGDTPPARTVVIEFPTMQAALAWYHGDEYAAARALREGAATCRMYVVDGV
jgi:uncharacterized protein (DUF1330 family)